MYKYSFTLLFFGAFSLLFAFLTPVPWIIRLHVDECADDDSISFKIALVALPRS